RALTSLGQFDLAWDHLSYVRQRYPDTPGLDEAIQAFLFANAGSPYQQGKLDRALATLAELYQMNADYPRAAAGLGAVADRVLKRYIDQEKNYRAARQLLQRLDSAYGTAIRSSLDSSRARLEELATAEKEQAEKHVAEGDFLAAHEAVRRMMRIWPQVAGGAELAARVSE